MLLAVLIAVAPHIPLIPGGDVAWFGEPRLQPGAWVEYAVIRPGKPQARLRASILGPASLNERHWLEMVTEEEGRPPTAVRMLLRNAKGPSETVERIYLYVAGQAPVALPMHRPSASVAKRQRIPERLGSEIVTLAIGRFECDVSRVEGTRMDHSARVPLWGLVRSVHPEMKVELIGFAESGAVSVFPAEFLQGNGSERANE